ncbi:hypothetical protein QAD02_003068 [Eretmocerus hayati]|uniref:Uncharacterized protein n=1 Tax=Eretmocerus hayati TaxID=131215 RepID=A0ACC2NNC4_9HYME|nr:hypothetical protein QAD02_003068 [Eretmocerus hayati]
MKQRPVRLIVTRLTVEQHRILAIPLSTETFLLQLEESLTPSPSPSSSGSSSPQSSPSVICLGPPVVREQSAPSLIPGVDFPFSPSTNSPSVHYAPPESDIEAQPVDHNFDDSMNDADPQEPIVHSNEANEMIIPVVARASGEALENRLNGPTIFLTDAISSRQQ